MHKNDLKNACTRVRINYNAWLDCFWCCMRGTVGENWYSRPSELASPRRE